MLSVDTQPADAEASPRARLCKEPEESPRPEARRWKVEEPSIARNLSTDNVDETNTINQVDPINLHYTVDRSLVLMARDPTQDRYENGGFCATSFREYNAGEKLGLSELSRMFSREENGPGLFPLDQLSKASEADRRPDENQLFIAFKNGQ